MKEYESLKELRVVTSNFVEDYNRLVVLQLAEHYLQWTRDELKRMEEE